jgi:hypothetical protein
MSNDNLSAYLMRINAFEVQRHQVFCLSDILVRDISELLDSGSLSLDRIEQVLVLVEMILELSNMTG